MDARRYVLIIVEGKTDKKSLYLGIKNYLEKNGALNKVGFDVFDGDFTILDQNQNRIDPGAVEDNIGESLRSYFANPANSITPDDVIAVATISDLDAAYCQDACIFHDPKLAMLSEEEAHPYYDLSIPCLYCKDVPFLVQRNQDKRDAFLSLNDMVTDGLHYEKHHYPFRPYYFGITLEHVLHDKVVYGQEEKGRLAASFRSRCKDPYYLFNALNSLSIATLNYESSWDETWLRNHPFSRISNVRFLLDWILSLGM